MNGTRTLGALLAVVLLMTPLAANARQSGRIPTIGVLGLPSLSEAQPRVDVFRDGLRAHGYVENSVRLSKARCEVIPEGVDGLCLVGSLGEGPVTAQVEVGKNIAAVTALVAIWPEPVEVERAGTPRPDFRDAWSPASRHEIRERPRRSRPAGPARG